MWDKYTYAVNKKYHIPYGIALGNHDYNSVLSGRQIVDFDS